MVKSGIVLSRRYEVLNKIGAGGMADVYKGRDNMLNRNVAIKVLKKEYREDENFVRKFRSEAQAAAGLMHPNIVNVYDVGEDRGLYYMVMELVEGITLKNYIEKKGSLSHREVISIAIQMCGGIAVAHEADIIHRDIKPQNIMISREGKVKVTDFGIAKATTSNTVSSNAMGSVHYTSPEQARGGYSDAKSDIYSIGITLYEMATGQVPFDGDSTVSVAIKHLQEEITPPSVYVPDIPYSLERIILKCTQKNVERRYGSVNELIRDMKRSMVDPEGDFVVIPPLRNADTVIISDDELDDIRRNYDDDGYSDGDDYEDDYDDDDDDYDYDDDDYDSDDDYGGSGRYGAGGKKRRRSGEEVNPRMNKVMKILMVVVAVIIVFIAVFAVGKAAGVFKSFGSGISGEEEESEEVEVPDIVGKSEEEALAILKEKELGMKVVSREESEKYDTGTVSEQKTEAGEEVKKNSTIEVIVSSGLVGQEITVPDVSGYSESDAQKELENAGFETITSDFQYSDTVDEGDVITTTPAANAKATKETEIKMTVSKGAEKKEVPDVRGQAEADARSAITGAGLTVGAVTSEYSDTVEQGKVISQSVTPGKKVNAGTAVDFVVSQGEKPEEKVMVPNLSGQTYEGASSMLSSMGLVIQNGGEEYSEEPVGTVSRWEPYNVEVSKGTAVTVIISRGPEPTDDTTESE